jgi:TetR/AcrR family transcriptional regulator, regulator of cefoperazone and chloramphenicol sensitivity
MKQTVTDSTQDTRRRLLEAALIVFADKGFDGAGIRDIAERAKANSAMVQYHFKGKEGLYLEALRYAFEQGPKWIHQLPLLPLPGDLGARATALVRFRDYLHNFLRDFMECFGTGKFLPIEVDQAAHVLWSREMQFPRPNVESFIKESIQPFIGYLNACLQIIRPDLDPEALFRMSMSIHGQLLWMHNHRELTRLLRGQSYSLDDLDSLTDHFVLFSLRGLGVPEAMTPQGA